MLIRWEQLELTHCWGSAMWYHHLEKQSSRFSNFRIIATCVSKRNDSVCTHKGSYTNVHSRFLHNSQTLNTTQVSFNRWIQNTVCPHNKYSSTILKRNTLLINAIIQESQNTMLNKRSQTWKRACWLIPFTGSSGEAKLEKWLPGVSVGERALRVTECSLAWVCWWLHGWRSTYIKTHPLHTSNGYIFLNCGKIRIHGT